MTRRDAAWTVTAAVCLTSPATVSIAQYVLRPFDFREAAVEVAAHSYDALGPAAVLSIILAAAALVLHRASCALRRGRVLSSPVREGTARLGEVLLFFAVAAVAVHLWGAPSAAFGASLAGIVYAVCFPLANLGLRAPLRGSLFVAWQTVPVLLAICTIGFLFYLKQGMEGFVVSGGQHSWFRFLDDVGWLGAVLLAWFAGLMLAAWRIGRARHRVRDALTVASRAACLVVSFPLLAVGALSMRTFPPSPAVDRVLDVPDLYDVKIDEGADRLLVTQGYHGTGQDRDNVGFSLPLDALDKRPKLIRLPTEDMEEIVVDAERRELYHIDRRTMTMYIVDADNYQIKRNVQIKPTQCEGSLRVLLIRSAGRFFVNCEGESEFNQLVIDRETFRIEKEFGVGMGAYLVGDEENGYVYIVRDESPLIEALNVHTLEIDYRGDGPEDSEPCALSNRRGELYMPASRRSEVWVHTVPDLRLVGKIPAPFVVRTVVLDDERGLMFAGSGVTGQVDIIDIATRRRIATHRVAKFGRIMAVDVRRSRLFWSTANRGLFAIDYSGADATAPSAACAD